MIFLVYTFFRQKHYALREGRFVFEKNEQLSTAESQKKEVGAGESFQERKAEARKEIDAIYDLGEYSTYNMRKLPQEFKDQLRDDFGQWIDANVSTYDKDKNSGIDAQEYKEFKDGLTKKVRGILDRLVQIKKERTEQAKAQTESAKDAKDRQELLDKGRKAMAEGKSLEGMEGVAYQLLEFQEDFKKDAESFSQMVGSFGTAKAAIDKANTPGKTGLSAVGDFARNHPILAGAMVPPPGIGTTLGVLGGVAVAVWADDTPEVKAAKVAKDEAVADMQKRLAEMKNRQKARMKKGAELNGAPEKIREKTKQKYEGYRTDAKSRQEEITRQKDLNDKKKQQMVEARENVLIMREAIDQKKSDQAGKVRAITERKEEFEKHSREMGTYERAVTQAIITLQQTIDQTPEPQKQELLDKLRKLVESQEKAKTTSEQMETAGKVTQQQIVTLEDGQNGATLQLGNLSVKMTKIEDVIKFCDTTSLSLDDACKKIDQQVIDLDKQELAELGQIDAMDKAVADTVLEVGVSNVELVSQAEQYLKMLQSMEARGPGILDTAGAVLKGIPGVEKATTWATKSAGDAWNSIKGVPVLGDAIQILGYMGEGWSKGIEAIGSGLQWVGDKLHLPDAWDWMSEASKHLSIGNPTGIPALDAVLDTITGGGLGTIIEVAAGVTDGVKEMVKGLGMMIAHPGDALRGIIELVNNPGMLIEAFLHKDKWHEESSGKIIGRMITDVAVTLTGGGATAKGFTTISEELGTLAAKNGGKITAEIIAKAAARGGIVFTETFAVDMSKLVMGILRSPATIAEGAGKLFQRIARGGKAAPELGEVAHAVVEAEDALTLDRPTLEAKTRAIVDDEAVTLDARTRAQKPMGKAPLLEEAQPFELSQQKKKKPAVPDGEDNLPIDLSQRKKHPGAGGVPGSEGNIPIELQKPLSKKPWGLPDVPPQSTFGKLYERAKTFFSKSEAPGVKIAAEVDDVAKLSPAELFSSLEKRIGQEPKLGQNLRSAIDNINKTLPPEQHLALADLQKILEPAELRLLVESDAKFLKESVLKKILQKDFDVIEMVEGGEKIGVRVYIDDTARIGKGGLGEVYEGYAVRWDRNGKIEPGQRLQKAAVKIEKEFNDIDATVNFARQNEFDTLAAVHALPDQGGLLRPYYVGRLRGPNGLPTERIITLTQQIERLPGLGPNASPSLSAIIKRLPELFARGAASPELALDFMTQALDGLKKLHRQVGRVHMDIKPGNIFAGMLDGMPRAVLGDLAGIPIEVLETLKIVYTPDATPFVFVQGKMIMLPHTPGYFHRGLQHLLGLQAWIKRHPGVKIPPNVMSLPDLGQWRNIITSGDSAMPGLLEQLQAHPDMLPPAVRDRVMKRLDALADRIDNVPNFEELRIQIEAAEDAHDAAALAKAKAEYDRAVDGLSGATSIEDVQGELAAIQGEIAAARSKSKPKAQPVSLSH